jgi:hypothetical protein
MWPEPGVTPSVDLREGHGVLGPTARVVDSLAVATSSSHLRHQQLREVSGMKSIASLVPSPIEPDVTQRPTSQVGIQPVREDPLIRRAELSGTCQNPTPVDPDWKVKYCAVF